MKILRFGSTWTSVLAACALLCAIESNALYAQDAAAPAATGGTSSSAGGSSTSGGLFGAPATGSDNSSSNAGNNSGGSSGSSTTVTNPTPSIEVGPTLNSISPATVIYDPTIQNPTYTLGPGDEFAIKVYPQSKYSAAPVPVDPDGTIALPKFGRFSVEGMTADQLAGVMKAKLAAFCINPDVMVTLLALRPQVVYVSGGVEQPKALDAHAASSVAKAITLAGGVSDRYMLANVAVVRGKEILHANLYPLLVKGQDNGENIPLQAGDLVIVPVNTAHFAVLGSVTNPGTFSLMASSASAEGPERLSDALMQAGGPEKHDGAKIGQIEVLRESAPGAKPEVLRYDYGKYLTYGDVQYNPIVQDGDVIVVPENKHVDPGSVFQYFPFVYLLRGL